MRFNLLCTGCFLALLTHSAAGQSVRPYKDLIFAQVAAGGGFETWITVTNRSTAPYTGSLSFYQGAGKPWNPAVDGKAVSGGTVAVSLPAGATQTFKISGAQTTESGFAAFVGTDLLQNNFIEGNLTYFVKSGSTVVDSIGVLPSTEFYLSTIPFEDFPTVALALVNRDPANQPASVKLTVFSQDNVPASTRTIAPVKNEQYVKYLWQEFGQLNLGRGRLEIESNIPIAGTALMEVQHQFSALPLLPTMRSYDVLTVIKGIASKGQMSLWAEGSYFKGFITVTDVLGMPVTPEAFMLSGQLQQGKLKLVIYVRQTSYGNPETVGYATTNAPFSFDMNSVECTFFGATLGQRASFGAGTFSMSRIN